MSMNITTLEHPTRNASFRVGTNNRLVETRLPGFSQRPQTSLENLGLDDIVLVHMTDRVPSNGIIQSLYRGHHKGGIRNTISFSLNHATRGNLKFNNSIHKEYAILCPLSEIISLNGLPLGGDELDLCWDNQVNVNSNKTVILANTQSTFTIESRLSQPNSRIQQVHMTGEPYKGVPTIIKRMGFHSLVEPEAYPRFTWVPLTSTQPEAITWEHVASINAAKKLFRDCDFPYYKRIHFPLKKLENYLKLLACCNPDSWIDSLLHANLQWFGEYTLQSLEEDLQHNPSLKKAIPMRLDELLTVIQQSPKPSDAIHTIKRRWGIDLEEYSKQAQPESYFGHLMKMAGVYHNTFHSRKYQQAINILNNQSVISMPDLMEYMQMVQIYEPTRYD